MLGVRHEISGKSAGPAFATRKALWAAGTVLVTGVFFALLGLTVGSSGSGSAWIRVLPAKGLGIRAKHSSAGSRRCEWTLVSYTSSPWEREWLEAGTSRINNFCSFMTQPESVAKSEEWVRAANESFVVDDIGDWIQRQSNSEVFSWFEYVNGCTGEKERIPIEPLVGAMRHPFTIPSCIPEGHDPMLNPDHAVIDDPDPIMNKGYMVVQPVTSETFASMHAGGRRYLFDLGTGMYRSGSLPWFENIYDRRGIKFDEVFAWEVKPADQSEYWQQVPDAFKLTLHYYNVPCSVDPASEFNPLQIMKTLYQPGDFVVIKLDIDNAPVEQALMDQIGADPALQAMISEMYFEQHFLDSTMPWFGSSGGDTTLADVQQSFLKFRSSGLRLHYWP